MPWYPDLPRLQNVSPGAVMVCATLFILGMMLLGSLKLAGGFYILSLVLGLYLLWRLPRTQVSPPPAIKIYLASYLGFVMLVVAHIVIFRTSTSHIDQVSRIGLGLLNGIIFFALFGFSRERLFGFVVLVAGAHACVAIAVALYQGVFFLTSNLWFARAHGVTNPIPFSEMLFTSVGLVAIAFAARLDRASRPYFGLLVLALIIGLGVFAVVLTGTRGTLTAVVLLLPLIMIALAGKVKLWLVSLFTVVALAVAAVAAVYLFSREPLIATLLDFFQGAPVSAYPGNSTGARLQLWMHGVRLIESAPLWGHGIDSMPEILQQSGLEVDPAIATFSHFHNQYLDILVKLGLVGAVLFFTPLVVALGVGLKMSCNPDERTKGLAILWAGGSYAIYGLTQVYYGHASTTLHYSVLVGMLLWVAPGGRYGDITQRPDTVS